MDPGVLDVLHHAANDAPGSVGQRVDVAFERVLQEAVDQHGMLGRDARRLLEVVAQ